MTSKHILPFTVSAVFAFLMMFAVCGETLARCRHGNYGSCAQCQRDLSLVGRGVAHGAGKLKGNLGKGAAAIGGAIVAIIIVAWGLVRYAFCALYGWLKNIDKTTDKTK